MTSSSPNGAASSVQPEVPNQALTAMAANCPAAGPASPPTGIAKPAARIAAKSPASPATSNPATTSPQSTATNSAATPANSQSDPSKRLITPTSIGFLLTAAALWFGYSFPTQRYIVPQRGIGYALGIIGGSLMLSLLLYPLRKRLQWTGFLGSVKGWFQAHMILGVVGPLLVLYHSNFSLGAPNSNAALFAMLLVSGSGIFGRYFYTRIHFGLYGRRGSRAEMQAAADELKQKVAGSRFVPDLLTMLDSAETRLLEWRWGKALLLVRPFFVTFRMYVERWRITRRAMAELQAAAKQSSTLRQQSSQFSTAVKRYIARRLLATRRVAEFESYERLFSVWHMFHMPMFFVLLIAGIVHVIAVHVY